MRVPARQLALLLACLGALATPAAARADDDDLFEGGERDERKRLSLTAWGGELSALSGSGRQSAGHVGGEVAWRFDAVELGLLGQAVRLRTGASDWSPVVLARITERFETRRGVEASFTFGLGAAREAQWKAWFQVALGARLDLGPIYVGGELGFEQNDFVRLAGCVGTRF